MPDTSPASKSASTTRGSITYKKVIDAGIEYIAENGLQHTSTNKIAKAAGVTWGTLQHQFGDRARLLEAILEYCFNQQMSVLSQSASVDQQLKQRIDALVEAIWANQLTTSNRVMQDIIYGVQGDPELRERFNPTMQKLWDFYNKQWQSLFADIEIAPQDMEAVKQLVFSALQGLAYDIRLRSDDRSILRAIDLLKQQVLDIFSTAGAD